MAGPAQKERIRGRHARMAPAAVIFACLLAFASGVPPAQGRDTPPVLWRWPLEPAVIAEPFHAPADRYGPGHRGVDLVAGVGADVHAPSDGVVAFAGVVVDRAILTIDHGTGYVTTLEPVDSELLPGARVVRGDVVGTVATGGHTAAGRVHVGVRLDGEYLNPLSLLGDVPRAVLLPCC